MAMQVLGVERGRGLEDSDLCTERSAALPGESVYRQHAAVRARRDSNETRSTEKSETARNRYFQHVLIWSVGLMMLIGLLLLCSLTTASIYNLNNLYLNFQVFGFWLGTFLFDKIVDLRTKKENPKGLLNGTKDHTQLV